MVVTMPSDVANDVKISRRPVCGVLAVAVACGVNFIDVWKHIAKKRGLNWKGSTYISEQLNAIKHFGCNYEVKFPKHFGINLCGFNKSLTKFVGIVQLVDPKAIFLVHTRNHSQIVQGSYVIDQSGKVHISKYHFKKRRVISVYKIINPNFDESKVPDIVKENIQMTARTNTKTTQAFEIFKRETANGKKRKEILAIMTDELNTTWGSASSFYHKAKKHAENGSEDEEQSTVAEKVVTANENELVAAE